MAKKKAKKKSTRKAASKKATRRASTRLELGAEIGIRDVADLHRRLTELVEAKQTVVVEAGSVSRVDFAVLQVLAAFVRDRRRQELDTRWEQASPTLRKAAERVDLSATLGLVSE